MKVFHVSEQEVVQLSDSDSDGLVKVNDFELICNVWVCCKLPGQVLLVVFKFPGSMRVHENNCFCVSGICN